MAITAGMKFAHGDLEDLLVNYRGHWETWTDWKLGGLRKIILHSRVVRNFDSIRCSSRYLSSILALYQIQMIRYAVKFTQYFFRSLRMEQV